MTCNSPQSVEFRSALQTGQVDRLPKTSSQIAISPSQFSSACLQVLLLKRLQLDRQFSFQPNPFQLDPVPLFGQNDVPRYLFRVYTPSTAGQTTDSYVTPPASTCGRAEKTRDIFRLRPAKAATRLNEHLRWWPSHESMCTLMSWTSSLLFALQHGLRRHNTDDDKPELSETSLLILDT